MLRYKACRNSIVTLELLGDTKNNEKRLVVNDKHAKFRCNKAKVLNITNVKTGELMEKDVSIFRHSFKYMAGEMRETYFNTDLNEVCAEGIHYFKTKEAALSWFYIENGKIYPDGKWTTWRENGRKQSEGTYKDGKEDGEWVDWWKNGNKMYKRIFKGGKLDGKFICWYNNGQKESEGTFKDGIKDGKWTEWYNNGNKRSEGTFKEWERDGKWTFWYGNGQKKSEGTFKDDMKDEKWTYWHEDGMKIISTK